MLDYLPEIRSDFSVFHRIRDLDEIDAPRFYEFAEQLPYYDGALRGRLLIEKNQRIEAAAEQTAPVAPSGPSEVSPAVLAAMSDHPGFPGIEYAGG